MKLIRKMANRYKNIDTTEEAVEEEYQMPKTQPQPSTKQKQIHRRNTQPNYKKHHVKFYFVQKDHETGRRLSKQIMM